jgi:type II secretory ATPase GspE/PulE/Tfp pilus assembly ATPase PilB-like protein
MQVNSRVPWGWEHANPHLIDCSAVIGVLAQRLVRTNCPHCKAVEPANGITLARTGVVSLAEVYRACM